MKKISITITFVLLSMGSIAGAFFYYDAMQKSEALRSNSNKISFLNAKVSDLKNDLKRIRKEADQETNLIQKLQGDIARTPDLEKSLEDKERALKEALREIQKCMDSKSAVESLRSADLSRTNKLQTEIESLNRQVIIIEEKVDEKTLAVASSEVKVSMLQTKHMREKEDLRQQIASLNQTIEDTDAQLHSAQEKIQGYQDEIASLDKFVKETKGRLQEAEDILQDCQGQMRMAEINLAAKETQISYLVGEIRRIEEAAARRNDQLKGLIQEKEVQLELERNQILSLVEHVKKEEETRTIIENKLFGLREQKDRELIEAGKTINQLRNSESEKLGRIEEQARQIAALNDQLTAVQKEIISMKARVKADRLTLSALGRENYSLKEDIEKGATARNVLDSALSALRDEKLKAQEAAEKQMAHYQDVLSQKEILLSAAETRLSALENQIERDKMRSNSLQQRVSELRKALRNEQIESAQRNSQLKQVIKEKELQLRITTAHILNMREAIEGGIESSTTGADRDTEPKAQGPENIQQVLKQVNEKIREKNRKLQNALKEVENWRGLYRDLEGSLDLTRDQLKKLQKRMAEVREEKGAMKNQLEELDTIYNRLISELRDNLENKEATIQEYRKQLTITFVNKILFGRAAVTIASKGRDVLRKTGEALKAVSYGKIRIVGHTDNDPIKSRHRRWYPSNWELSGARAASVARFFQNEIGIAPERIEIMGLAFTKPIASNETEEGKAKNRRVEIIVVPKQ